MRGGRRDLSLRLALSLLCIGLISGRQIQPDKIPPRRPWVSPRGAALTLFEPAFTRRGLAFPPDPCELADRGANTVLLPVLFEQWSLTIGRPEWSEEGITRDDLRAVIRRARRCSLQTVVTPLIEIRGGEPGAWRGRLRPLDRDAWWAAYGELLLELAALAEAEQVDTLVINHELSSLCTPRQAQRWRAAAGLVRAHFSGRIGAALNHDALEADLPFDAFDAVGVSAYFSLTNELDPDATELARGWSRASRELERFSRRIGRPITLFEVGYASIDGAASAPWNHTLGAPIDLREQAMAYGAAVDAIESMPFVDGALFWAWGGPGGRLDRSFSPRDKPAEAHVRRWFRSSEPTRR